MRPLLLSSALLVLSAMTPSSAAEFDVMRLFDFSARESVETLRPMHDTVMGGVSRGAVQAIEGAARLAGDVSLENNGGFASFRIAARFPSLSAYDGLRLRVRGDGQVYKLGVRTDGRWNGVSWQASFATRPGEWSTVDIAFEDFAPTWRGRLVTDAPALDASMLRQVGVSISDKQDGDFAIDIASIDVWRAAGDEFAAGRRKAEGDRTSALAAAIDGERDSDALREMLRWDERVLVIASPDVLDAASSKQIARFLAERHELTGRELRVVQLMGSRGGRMSGATLSREQSDGLREAWDLSTATWQIALVGKDGSVKERWTSAIEPRAVFELIDVMPMRLREIEERGRG